MTSHEKFKDNLYDLYPSFKSTLSEKMPQFFYVSSQPQTCPNLSEAEKAYVQILASITPLDSILDRKEGTKKCKEIGQQIFDQFKLASGGKTSAGREAAQRICDAIKFQATDGTLRKQYIERAWDGIGDEYWRWMA